MLFQHTGYRLPFCRYRYTGRTLIWIKVWLTVLVCCRSLKSPDCIGAGKEPDKVVLTAQERQLDGVSQAMGLSGMGKAL